MKRPEYIKITSIEDLDNALKQGIHSYLISFGIARSSKDIHEAEREGYYEIYNYIDDTEQILSREQIMDREYTNIGESMKNGTFYAEKY